MTGQKLSKKLSMISIERIAFRSKVSPLIACAISTKLRRSKITSRWVTPEPTRKTDRETIVSRDRFGPCICYLYINRQSFRSRPVFLVGHGCTRQNVHKWKRGKCFFGEIYSQKNSSGPSKTSFLQQDVLSVYWAITSLVTAFEVFSKCGNETSTWLWGTKELCLSQVCCKCHNRTASIKKSYFNIFQSFI